jgi:hypothetical protein
MMEQCHSRIPVAVVTLRDTCIVASVWAVLFCIVPRSLEPISDSTKGRIFKFLLMGRLGFAS